MLKAYALGFFSAALAVLVAVAIWLGTRQAEEPALLWGGGVYATKQEFEGYLKSKGLSYKTWLARHPGAAPWEPGAINIGAITIRASTKTREDWVVRLPLLTIGSILAGGATLLLLRGLRSFRPRLATTTVAFSTAVVTVLLVAVIWFAAQPRHEPGLMWGGTVYTTKEEFKGYLKSKGLSYETWLSRNPGAAPWEPAPAGRPTRTREDRMFPLLLAALGLTLAAACGFLIVRRGRAKVRVATRFTSVPLRLSRRPTVNKPTGRGGFPGRLALTPSCVTGSLRQFILLCRGEAVSGARAEARRLRGLARDRNISIGYLASALIAAMTAGAVGVLIASLLSS